MMSLKAKLKAWVGKYRTMLATLPRQKEANPCSAVTRVKQFTMPVYRATSPEMIFGLASWVWISSFTRSMGAVIVLAMEPDTPPAARSLRKEVMENSFLAGTQKCSLQDAIIGEHAGSETNWVNVRAPLRCGISGERSPRAFARALMPRVL